MRKNVIKKNVGNYLNFSYICCHSIFVVRSKRLHLRLSSLSHDGIFSDLQRTNCFRAHCHSPRQNRRSSVVLVVLCCELQESFLKGHVKCSDLPARLSSFFKILDGSTSSDAVRATSRIIIVISIDALQPLEIFHYLYRMLKNKFQINFKNLKKKISFSHLINQSVLGKLFWLLAASQVEFSRCQNMRNRSETMKQHRSKLDDQNQREEEHKHQTDWLELEIFFCDVNLRKIID